MFGKAPSRIDDPAAAAGNLILRIGIAILAIGVPCGAVLSRRLVFVLMPIGAALVLIGGLLVPGEKDRLGQLSAVTRSPLVIATFFLVVWAGFSLLWTPFAELAIERFLKTAGTVFLAAAAAVALPRHVKASNSNLLPIGVAAAALAIVCVGLITPGALRSGEADGSTLQRATLGAIVLAWPALGALSLRHRVAAAGILAIAVAAAAVIVWLPYSLFALIVALLTFSIAYSNPRLAGKVLAVGAALLILAAPAIPLVLQALPGSRIGDAGMASGVQTWAQIIHGEGLRLITGHGFDTTARAVAAGYLPGATPRGILFEIWYELGVLGAAGLAVLAWFAFRSAGKAAPAIAPFLLAALTGAVTLSIAGLSIAQLWWVTLLAVAAISFATVMRGHHREVRVPVREIMRPRPVL